MSPMVKFFITVNAMADRLEPEMRGAGADRYLVLRVLKSLEELGESAQAALGHVGGDSIKGESRPLSDALGELMDTAFSALVTVALFGNLEERMEECADKVGGLLFDPSPSA